MKKYLTKLFKEASEKLNYIDPDKVIFSIPKEKSFGDISTNYPLLISKELKKSPVAIAKEIVSNLNYSEKDIEMIDIAGPGFINFKFTKEFISRKLYELFNTPDDFGKSIKYKNKNALVEFVSANPTGPLTIGHGRNAVLGDTYANLLDWVGYNVQREYYFNNAGRQMRVLGESVQLRYKELCGESITFPEDYYQGEYIKDIAKKIYDEYGKNNPLVDLDLCKKTAENLIFEDIKSTLTKINIKFDTFFNEDSLYKNQKIDEIVDRFTQMGMCYEKDGAKWLALSKLGKENDKVIIKSTGEPTYRLPDIAYHVTKFERNFDLLIDIFGADHIATYPDVLAGLEMLGYDSKKVKVIIHQFVTLVKDNEIVKMSTRKANFVTLDELIDEVGPDVVRFFFLMRSPSTHLNFDLNLAKKSSDENPVFYLQYAHARICGIIRMLEEQAIDYTTTKFLLNEPEEIELIKHLDLFPEIIEQSAESLDILTLINYLNALAEKFHRFYHEHRVLGVDPEISKARLILCLTCKKVLGNGLKILGINAPERM